MRDERGNEIPLPSQRHAVVFAPATRATKISLRPQQERRSVLALGDLFALSSNRTYTLSVSRAVRRPGKDGDLSRPFPSCGPFEFEVLSSGRVRVAPIAWARRIKRVKREMRRVEVEKLLPPGGMGVFSFGNGGSDVVFYEVEPGVQVRIGHDHFGSKPMRDGEMTRDAFDQNRVLEVPTLSLPKNGLFG